MPPIDTAAGIVELTMRNLLPGKFDSSEARVMLLATGMQESRFEYRQQIGGGPGRSYWQFEQGGGIHGVLKHPASSTWAKAACLHQLVAPTESDVYAAFLSDDKLACAFARLLLWTDAAPLPRAGDADTAWGYYLRNWRPGAHSRGDDKQRTALRAKWETNYRAALKAGG